MEARVEVVGWSIVEVRMIQQLWEIKTVQYIANMLNRPMAEVQRKVNEMLAEADYKVKLYELPHFKRVIQKKDKEWLQEKQIVIPNNAGKIAVRLDAKTVVLVKPGTDIEALKRKHLERRRM